VKRLNSFDIHDKNYSLVHFVFVKQLRLMAFTCKVVNLGNRWVCTSEDGTKTWFAGPDYRYQDKLAGEVILEPEPKPEPKPEPEPPVAGTTVIGPYPSIGEELQSTQRGPTTRNYASGKPSDETIEKNVKDIKYRNHQFIVYVTMHQIEHDDNISLKLGGTHMGTGWFDHGVKFQDGLTCLGNEPDHPETNSCIKKGPKIGSVIEKSIGIAATYYADSNYTELWTNLGEDKGGWKKQLEGADIGGFNPKAKEFECQLRIDGFKKGSVPTIHKAVVQPIAPKN
jgi:hypothetical protein